MNKYFIVIVFVFVCGMAFRQSILTTLNSGLDSSDSTRFTAIRTVDTLYPFGYNWSPLSRLYPNTSD